MAVLKGIGAAIKGFGKALTGKNKVGPTITSVKPSVTVRKKGMKASIKKAKGDEYHKRIKSLDSANQKVKEGRKMMRQGQKERKNMTDTGRAFQFKGGSRHAVEPGESPKTKYKGLLKGDK